MPAAGPPLPIALLPKMETTHSLSEQVSHQAQTQPCVLVMKTCLSSAAGPMTCCPFHPLAYSIIQSQQILSKTLDNILDLCHPIQGVNSLLISPDDHSFGRLLNSEKALEATAKACYRVSCPYI